jgi:hypothetical protein
MDQGRHLKAEFHFVNVRGPAKGGDATIGPDANRDIARPTARDHPAGIGFSKQRLCVLFS